MPKNVLVADDERPLRDALSRFIRSLELGVELAVNGEEALTKLDRADLLVSDVRMPGLDGLSLLAEAKRRRPQLPVVLLTGHGSVPMAVQAMRAGAANFLLKPFDLDELEDAIRGALRVETRPPDRATGPTLNSHLLGTSPPMRALRDLVERIAASDATVLIGGESGAGKEVVARAIHARSRRAERPFVAVNCGAIPEALLESELFGHARGAFTGADRERVGHFGAAEGGTLLLDEIGELPLHLQVKLLRVLADRAYTPVGESTPRPADVRVIAATNRDLEAMVAAGKFREDLYYRLNVLPVLVPPLRERGEDVVLLADAFLARAALEEGRGRMSLDEDVLTCLRRYAWPGNVRELEHTITRATVLAIESRVTLADLPAKVRAAFAEVAPPPAQVLAADGPLLPDEGVDLNATLEGVEKSLIFEALKRTGGNRNKAAALLRIRRTTLVEKLKRIV